MKIISYKNINKDEVERLWLDLASKNKLVVEGNKGRIYLKILQENIYTDKLKNIKGALTHRLNFMDQKELINFYIDLLNYEDNFS